MKKCPYCAEEIQDEAIVCRYCGRELTKPAPVPLPQPIQQPASKQAKKPKNLIRAIALVSSFCLLGLCFIGIVRQLGSSKPSPTNKATSPNSNVVILTNTPAGTKTPAPTRTPRPTATPKVGTVDNPYPYGMEIPLTFTSLDKKSNFTVQVLNVIRGDDANGIVKSANQFNDDPPAGASWMLVQLKITLTDGSAYRLTSYDVSIISGGQIFGGLDFSVCCTKDVGFPDLDANIALPGTSVEGWVVRPVLLTDERPLLALGINSYSPDLKDGIFLALHP